MGRISQTGTGLAGALFPRVQLRVLSLLIGQPDRSFHASEIIRLAKSGSGAVQREIEKLAKAGILDAETSGNRKIYRANRQSPIFGELHGIIVKTTGLLAPLRKALKKYQSNIEFAFVYGSIAKKSETAKSDIDLMIVGNNLAYGEIYSALQPAEKNLLRSINPNLMTPREWKEKSAGKSSFIKRIQSQPKLFVFGAENDLERTG